MIGLMVVERPTPLRPSRLPMSRLRTSRGAPARMGRVAPPAEIDALHRFLGAPLHFPEAADLAPERIAMAGRPEQRAADVLVHRQVVEDVRHLEAARQALAVDLEGLEAGDIFLTEKN